LTAAAEFEQPTYPIAPVPGGEADGDGDAEGDPADPLPPPVGECDTPPGEDEVHAAITVSSAAAIKRGSARGRGFAVTRAR
jgi:hypothetical protein